MTSIPTFDGFPLVSLTLLIAIYHFYRLISSGFFNLFLISTFADKFLKTLDDDLLDQYDTLINEPSNDWDIYHWVTGAKETPQQYENKVMEMLKRHAQNEDMEVRIRQPDLKF